MSSQEGKYLDFHHGTPEAVTPPRCASGHSEPRSPCPSIPININLTGAPLAVCPLEEKPAQTRGVRSAARAGLRGAAEGCCRGAGCGIPVPLPRRAGPGGGRCWRRLKPGARRRQFLKLPLGARKTGWKRMCIHVCMCMYVYENCPGEYRHGNI